MPLSALLDDDLNKLFRSSAGEETPRPRLSEVDLTPFGTEQDKPEDVGSPDWRQKKYTELYEKFIAEGNHAEEAAKLADKAMGGTGVQPHYGAQTLDQHDVDPLELPKTIVAKTVEGAVKYGGRLASATAGSMLGGPLGAYAGYKTAEAREKYVDPVLNEATSRVSQAAQVATAHAVNPKEWIDPKTWADPIVALTKPSEEGYGTAKVQKRAEELGMSPSYADVTSQAVALAADILTPDQTDVLPLIGGAVYSLAKKARAGMKVTKAEVKVLAEAAEKVASLEKKAAPTQLEMLTASKAEEAIKAPEEMARGVDEIIKTMPSSPRAAVSSSPGTGEAMPTSRLVPSERVVEHFDKIKKELKAKFAAKGEEIQKSFLQIEEMYKNHASAAELHAAGQAHRKLLQEANMLSAHILAADEMPRKILRAHKLEKDLLPTYRAGAELFSDLDLQLVPYTSTPANAAEMGLITAGAKLDQPALTAHQLARDLLHEANHGAGRKLDRAWATNDARVRIQNARAVRHADVEEKLAKLRRFKSRRSSTLLDWMGSGIAQIESRLVAESKKLRRTEELFQFMDSGVYDKMTDAQKVHYNARMNELRQLAPTEYRLTILTRIENFREARLSAKVKKALNLAGFISGDRIIDVWGQRYGATGAEMNAWSARTNMEYPELVRALGEYELLGDSARGAEVRKFIESDPELRDAVWEAADRIYEAKGSHKLLQDARKPGELSWLDSATQRYNYRKTNRDPFDGVPDVDRDMFDAASINLEDDLARAWAEDIRPASKAAPPGSVVPPEEGELHGPLPPPEPHKAIEWLEHQLETTEAEVIKAADGTSEWALPDLPEGATYLDRYRRAGKAIAGNLSEIPKVLGKLREIWGARNLDSLNRVTQSVMTVTAPFYRIGADLVKYSADVLIPEVVRNLFFSRATGTKSIEHLRQLSSIRATLMLKGRQLLSESFNAAIPPGWRKPMMAQLRTRKIREFLGINGRLPFGERGFDKMTDRFIESTIADARHFGLVGSQSDIALAGEWVRKHPWGSDPNGAIGSLGKLGGENVQKIYDAAKTWEYAYKQFGGFRDAMESWARVEGMVTRTKNAYMPQVNIARTAEHLATGGAIDDFLDALYRVKTKSRDFLNIKSGHALRQQSVTGFITDPALALEHTFEDLIKERVAREMEQVVLRDPNLVWDGKGTPPKHYQLVKENNTPLKGKYISPEAYDLLLGAKEPLGLITASMRLITAIPRSAATSWSAFSQIANRVWAVTTVFGNTGRSVLDPNSWRWLIKELKQYNIDKKALRSTTDYHSLARVDGNLVDAELMGVTQNHLQHDPQFARVEDKNLQRFEDVTGVKVNRGVVETNLPRLHKMNEALKSLYTAPDEWAKYLIYKHNVEAGVPKLVAVERALDGVVSTVRAGRLWQALSHSGLSLFMPWRMEAVPSLIRQMGRNPAAYLNGMVMASATTAAIAALMPQKYNEDWPGEEKNKLFLPKVLQTAGYDVGGTGNNSILATNTRDIINIYSALDGFTRDGWKGFVRMMKNNPVYGLEDAVNNRDPFGKPIYDPRLELSEEGQSLGRNKIEAYLLNRMFGSTIRKIGKYAKDQTRGMQDKYGNRVSYVNLVSDVIFGIKVYEIETEKARQSNLDAISRDIKSLERFNQQLFDAKWVKFNDYTPTQAKKLIESNREAIRKLLKEQREMANARLKK